MLSATKYKGTRKTHRLYYSTAPSIGGPRPNDISPPNRKSSPSRSLPISHIHFTSPPHKIPNGTVHAGEIPIGSLDNKNCRTEQLSGVTTDRPHSPLSSDDEIMFHPKPPMPASGGPPPSSFHRPQTNSSLEGERRAKRSKISCNGSTDETKKKKRHSYLEPLTSQPPKDLDTKDVPEIVRQQQVVEQCGISYLSFCSQCT